MKTKVLREQIVKAQYSHISTASLHSHFLGQQLLLVISISNNRAISLASSKAHQRLWNALLSVSGTFNHLFQSHFDRGRTLGRREGGMEVFMGLY